MDDRSASISAGRPATRPQRPASRTERLLTGPILPTLLRLSAPNVLNLLAIVGMITFDGIFIGRLGADALAGVSLVFPWVMFMQHAAASGMGGGVSSAIARALGAGQRDLANALAIHALALAIALSALVSALMLLCGPAIYRAMGGEGSVLSVALAYSDVAFGGVVTIWLLNTVANMVRGTGNMTLPALVLIGSVLAHIALSSVLIFGWGPIPAQGPAGAGWGLILAFAGGTAVLVAHLRSPDALVRLELRGVTPQRKLFADILRVGAPGMVNVAVTNLSVVVLTAIAGRLGQDVALGYAMGARLEYILIPIAFGFGTAIVAMVGTNWGARQFERARRIAWMGGATVGLACGCIGLFLALFPHLWMRLFTEEPGIVQSGSAYLAIAGPAYALYGLGMGLYFGTQGVGRVLATVAANGARFIFSACAGLGAIFWLGAGAHGLFVAIAGGFVLYGALTICALLTVRAHRAALILLAALMGAHGEDVYAQAHFRTASVHADDARSLPTARQTPYQRLLERHRSEDRRALRARQDVARHRLWVLTTEHVYVYDTRSLALIHRIRLPAWPVGDVDLMCPPDLVLDRRGSAFVSSNMLPVLLEIEPLRFAQKRHDVKLVGKERDIGFGALAFASDGTLLALTALAGALYRIDLRNLRATEIALQEPLVGRCSLTRTGEHRSSFRPF